MEDEFSSYVLAFSLLTRPYRGLDIANLKLRVHDGPDRINRPEMGFGLPHCSFRFENGIWRSRAADPGKNEEFCRLVREQEEILARIFGVSIEKFGRPSVTHYKARNPQSKTVEGSFGFYQRLQSLWPGHVGFNEREEKCDKEKTFEAAVRSGKAHPGEHWLSITDFRDKISRMVEDINAQPRSGRTKNRSPREVWQEHRTRRHYENFHLSIDGSWRPTWKPSSSARRASRLWAFPTRTANWLSCGGSGTGFYHVDCPNWFTFAIQKPASFPRSRRTPLCARRNRTGTGTGPRRRRSRPGMESDPESNCRSDKSPGYHSVPSHAHAPAVLRVRSLA